MQQSPAIDTDSPVVADAEFDPPVAKVGNRATYRITLSAMDESVKLPDKLPTPAGLELEPGGRAQNYLPGGAKLVPRTAINFRVKAQRPGTYTMPEFTVLAYGKPVAIPVAKITFEEPGPAGAQEGHRLLLELPPGDLYVGQAIPVRVILPDPGDGSVQGMMPPQFVGDAFQGDITMARQTRGVVNLQGRPQMALTTDAIVSAIKSGNCPLLVQAQAIITRPILNAPGRINVGYVLVDSDPLTVSILPLPKENRLPGFTDAVGTFQLLPPKVSAAEVRAGEPVLLTVSIQGEGNVARLVPPRFGNLRDWQTFPPLSDAGPVYQTPQRAARTYTYTLIPLSARIRSTPPLPFAYFDPKRKTYVDLTVPPVPLKVSPAPGGVVLPDQSAAATPDLETDNAERRERSLALTGLVETPAQRALSLRPLQEQPWFLALQLLPATVLAGLWAAERRRQFLTLHPEVLRKRRARRGLRRCRRQLQRAAASRDVGEFVTAAVRALREVSAPHTAANPAAVVCSDVLGELSSMERNGRDGELVRRLFAAADAWRILGRVPDEPALLHLKPELESLLAEFAKRL